MLGYKNQPNIIIHIRSRDSFPVVENQSNGCMRIHAAFASCEEEVAMSQGIQTVHRSWKRWEIDLPLEAPEWNVVFLTL